MPTKAGKPTMREMRRVANLARECGWAGTRLADRSSGVVLTRDVEQALGFAVEECYKAERALEQYLSELEEQRG